MLLCQFETTAHVTMAVFAVYSIMGNLINPYLIIVLQKSLLSTKGTWYWFSGNCFLRVVYIWSSAFAPSITGMYCRSRNPSSAYPWAVTLKKFDMITLFIPMFVTIYVYCRIKWGLKRNNVLSDETAMRVQIQVARRAFVILGVYNTSIKR
jgi:hypothetical protein